MTVEPASLLPVALDAVALAADLMRTRAPGPLTAKGDRDMASEVDYAVERAVREHLRAKTPDIAFLGEEEGLTGDGELMWVLDPVDGTANYVRGLPLCGVSLGLIHGDRPVVGVIDLPFLDVRYHAAQGAGAFAGERRLRVGATDRLQDAVVAISDYAVGEGADAENRIRLALSGRLAATVQRVRMLGSAALDLAWVADGKLDAAVLLSNKPWDTSAGVLIAREAGAVVVDLDGTDHTTASTAAIAIAPALADRLIALIREVHPAASGS
ncbi:inositol monophosphatase family protein [Thermomonospora catenispora]|uniref:inositol monophosphatase family protein n=1 Tax=Thermomonospora catenispora TaxID=2493090 RepID=UPI00111D717C|nr:inositol monophosphatase family protein [Thermomonospora catenispora]TNY36835.1 inositol monophosphatase family protein [Thermomonospora catenispora]